MTARSAGRSDQAGAAARCGVAANNDIDRQADIRDTLGSERFQLGNLSNRNGHLSFK
jgi:hypothetical protein